MARRIYTLFFYLALPFIVLRLYLRSLKAPAYRCRMAERFGFFASPSSLRKTIWVHAVSVGEAIAAEPVIRRLLARYPERDIVVTTMTPTGSERVRALFGDSVFHVYAPYDIPCALRRFLNAIQPEILVVLETELWPNTIHSCHQREVPVLLVNARLSEKSARGYHKLAVLSRPMLQSLSRVVAQAQADADRFCALGVARDRILVSGSIKFDIAISDELRKKAGELRSAWGENRLIWIAASTHTGEDQFLLNVFQQLKQQYSQLLLVLVPRHPERFESVCQLVAAKGFSVLRRSEGAIPENDIDVVVGDTMGELLLLYGLADMAFVGGSLVETGGHNMLEPAAWGLPIVTGPSDYNFIAISELLQQSGGLIKVSTEVEMVAQLTLWAGATDLRRAAGGAAARVVDENRGALETLCIEIENWLGDA